MPRPARWLALPALSLAFACAAAEPPAAPIEVGSIAPDFTLPAAGGGTRTLSQVAGKKPVVLVFFRGVW